MPGLCFSYAYFVLLGDRVGDSVDIVDKLACSFEVELMAE